MTRSDSHRWRIGAAACFGLLLVACSGTSATQRPTAPATASVPGAKVTTAVAEAVVAPLDDLNLVHAKIPPVLLASRRQPYAVPDPISCEAIADEIDALDIVLGPDLDAPKDTPSTNAVARGVESADGFAAGKVRQITREAIPFRGWIRGLSGADRHSEKVEAALRAGGIRRGFLKGLRQASECAPPAASS